MSDTIYAISFLYACLIIQPISWKTHFLSIYVVYKHQTSSKECSGILSSTCNRILC